MAESVHKKLSRVRPPRVNISYEVHTGDAIEMKELPFVMGILGDFTGQPKEPLDRPGRSASTSPSRASTTSTPTEWLNRCRP
jgi:hypothetical protein